MKTASCVGLVAAALVLGHLRLAAGEAGSFRYLAAVYFDDKGAGLQLPEGVACGGDGQMVVGDTGNDRLVRFTFRDKAVTGGTEIRNPQLSAPTRVQLNSKGEIYAFDGRQRRIVHFGADGAFKEVLAFDGLPAPATIVAKDFRIDQADNIYVLDIFSARVLVLDAAARFKKAVPFPDDAGSGAHLAIDASQTLLLLDGIKRRMFSAGKDASAFAPLGGDLTGFLPTLPTYMTANRGAVFVAEGGGSIASLGSDGSFLARQLTMGWTEGLLNHPSQLCVNDKDEVFVADRDNSRIQIFQLTR